jgi:hypothetical protein
MMLARILGLVGAANADALAAAASRARGVVQPTLVEMAERTLALYDRTAALAPSGLAPFDPARVRQTLPGGLLSRFAPARVRKALRSRLR